MGNYKIDFSSFIKKPLPKREEDYQTSLICGKMGTGKSYFAIYYIEKYLRRKKKVITNIGTYKSTIHEVKYFKSIGELYDILKHEGYDHSILIFDECYKAFPKDCKIDKAFYELLQHARKLNLHIYLIFQEYLMVPNWLRGVCDTIYTTHSFLHFLCKTDIGNPVLDKETFEWGMENFGFLIYKRVKEYGSKYDTSEILLT